MAHICILDNHFEYGNNVCRLLEIRANNQKELEQLVAAAEKKLWTVWLPPQPIQGDLGWGAVLEKGMEGASHLWLAFTPAVSDEIDNDTYLVREDRVELLSMDYDVGKGHNC